MSKIPKLLKQAFAFIGISGIGWCIDFVIYLLLNQFIEAQYANMISAAAGVSFVFWVSTRKTFKNNIKRLSLKWKYLIYLVYQVGAILGASALIAFVQKTVIPAVGWELLLRYSYIAAKIIVTPFTLCLNFIVMKILVEKV